METGKACPLFFGEPLLPAQKTGSWALTLLHPVFRVCSRKAPGEGLPGGFGNASEVSFLGAHGPRPPVGPRPRLRIRAAPLRPDGSRCREQLVQLTVHPVAFTGAKAHAVSLSDASHCLRKAGFAVSLPTQEQVPFWKSTRAFPVGVSGPQRLHPEDNGKCLCPLRENPSH